MVLFVLEQWRAPSSSALHFQLHGSNATEDSQSSPVGSAFKNKIPGDGLSMLKASPGILLHVLQKLDTASLMFCCCRKAFISLKRCLAPTKFDP